MKTDNRMAKAVGLLVLSLLFAGIFMAAQRRGEFQAQAYPFGVWIQSEGLCTLSTDDQITDAAISEQDLSRVDILPMLMLNAIMWVPLLCIDAYAFSESASPRE